MDPRNFLAELKRRNVYKVLAQAPLNSQELSLNVVRALQLFYERRLEEAMVQIQHGPPAIVNDPRTITLLADCQRLTGKKDEARISYAHAVTALKPTPDSAVPVDARELPCFLAWGYAGVGEKEKALEQARHAIADYNNDALVRPFAEIILAMIQAQFGDSDSAIAALPHLLEVPNGETLGGLRTNPLWDPLRQDPRLKKLCPEKSP